MADMINFTLPTFSEDSTSKDIKQIKSYLFSLTEQLKFYLNNIDSDNYNDDYRQKMASLISTTTSNSVKATVVQESMRKMKQEYDDAINEAVRKISGNLGGYIVTLDCNEDGYPDDLRILVDTYDYRTATKYWQFNREGLGFIIKEGDKLTANLALTADGYIAAERIKGIIGSFVTLNACTLNACTGDFTGSVTASSGKIGNWTILSDTIRARVDGSVANTCFEVNIKNDLGDNGKETKKAFYVNYFTGGYNSDTIGKDKELEAKYKEERFYVRRNGEVLLKYGQIGQWYLDPASKTASGGLYSDHGNWRIYLQCAYNSNTTTRNDFFALATRYKGTTGFCVEDGYYVTGGIKMDGRFYTDKGYYIMGAGQGVYRYDYVNNVKYDLLTYTAYDNLTLGDFDASGNVNIYSPNRIFFCLGKYAERVYISHVTYEGVGTFNGFISNRGIVFEANNRNSEIMLACLRLRLSVKNITTTGNLFLSADGLIVTSSSSVRFKENITDVIDAELDPMNLLDAELKQFNYKEEYKDSVIFAGKQIGFIAEELEKVYPIACLYNSSGEVDNWNERIVITALFQIIKNIYAELKEIKNEYQS